MAVLRRLFFIVVFIVVIDDWFWFPFFIFSLFCFKFDLIPSYITLCERKGSFLPRFRKLSSETTETDSNRFKPRAARRTTKTRKERREKRRKTTLSTKISLDFFLSSSSVLLSKKNHLFLKGKTKKKREEEKKKTNFFKMGETNQLKRTIFYILGVFTSNRSFLHKSKRALQ